MTTVATWLLNLSGLALLGIGGYFVLVRPALLLEDARFMGTTPADLLKAAPGLARWLKHGVPWSGQSGDADLVPERPERAVKAQSTRTETVPGVLPETT